MAGYLLKEGGLISVSLEELSQRYRRTKQMVAMHYALSSSARRKARLAELVLVAASVVFLMTTFADDQLFQALGLDSQLSRVVLGLASAGAFFCSLALMIVDWAGTSARHHDAGDRFGEVLLRFRQERLPDKTWPEEIRDELSAAYEQVNSMTPSIPDEKFNSLKVRYLTKKKISALASENPGAPHILLWVLVKVRGAKSAVFGGRRG